MVAKGCGYVISCARTDNHHTRIRNCKSECQVVRIFIHRFLHQVRMPRKEFRGEIDDPLISSVIYPYRPAGEIAVWQIVALVLDLLVRSPHIAMVGAGRLVEKQKQRKNECGYEIPISARGLQAVSYTHLRAHETPEHL